MNNSKALKGFFKDAERILALPADVAQLKESGGGGADLTEIRAGLAALVDPITATFSIANPVVECGTNLTDVTFNWNIAHYSGAKSAKIMLGDGSATLETLSAASGTVTKAFSGSGVKNDAVASLGYKLDIIDGNNKTITVNASLYWRLAMYWGTSSSATLDEAGIKSLANKVLKSDMAGEYEFKGLADGQTNYKYFVIPAAFATIALYNKVSGFAFPLISVATVNVTNNGVTTSYKVLRSENAVGNVTVRN